MVTTIAERMSRAQNLCFLFNFVSVHSVFTILTMSVSIWMLMMNSQHAFSWLVRTSSWDKLALFQRYLWCIESADVAKTGNGIFWHVFRFLYKQLLLFFDDEPKAKENCIFESSADSHQLQLKPKISLHLYTNQCPEGAANNFYFKYSCLLFLSYQCLSIQLCPFCFA